MFNRAHPIEDCDPDPIDDGAPYPLTIWHFIFSALVLIGCGYLGMIILKAFTGE